MKVCIYVRVSTEDQNVEQQIDYLKEWCKNKNYNIIKCIADEESGRLPLIERKQFLKLLNESKKGNYEAIVIYNLDRLTRNWDDVTLIEKHFRDNWDVCKLISIADTIDLSNASGRMMFRIKMAVGCYMPEDMREKQKIGIERAKAEGKFKGGTKGRTWSNN
jgi:DNA invertase Pin-like site-specific DNA recombinase